MIDDQLTTIRCAGCGLRIDPGDVVTMSREILPTWVSSDQEPEIAIIHAGCEVHDDRADGNWMREAPQTLARALMGMARRGAD
jgi:DNA recombination-dependent growth factor C